MLQTLLTHLMDAQCSLAEEGYLVATLEAAVSFISQVNRSGSTVAAEQLTLQLTLCQRDRHDSVFTTQNCALEAGE